MKFAAALLLSLGLIHGSHAQNGGWNYEGRYYWPEQTNFPKCGGRRQSPINIDTEHVFQDDTVTKANALTTTSWTTANAVSVKWKNDGNTFSFSKDPEAIDLDLQTALPKHLDAATSYGFFRGYFTVGSESDRAYIYQEPTLDRDGFANRGSGHTIDGEGFVAEMELIFLKSSIGDYAGVVASSTIDDVVGVSILFTETKETNTDIDNFLVAVTSLSDPTTTTASVAGTTVSFDLSKFLPEDSFSNNGFYLYDGSFQRPEGPDCLEKVTWVVLEDTVPISKAQLDYFRGENTIMGGKMVDHFRQTMPMNNRVVHRVRTLTSNA